MAVGRALKVSVGLLGPFAIEGQGTRVFRLDLASRRGRALIAYLAMQPDHRASREHLANLLWGDSGDAQARQSLRQCLASLRQDLQRVPDLLVVDRDSVGLLPQNLTVDARNFAIFGESSQMDKLTRAAALFRGAFLADLSLDIEEFDAWREREGARLAAIAARVFERLADTADAHNEADAAVAAAEQLLALDPTREDWQRKVLRLTARHRGREAALSRAKACVDLLRRELDVGPERQTLSLIEAIRSPTTEPPISPRQGAQSAPPAAAPATTEMVRPRAPTSPAPEINVSVRTRGEAWPSRWMVGAAVAGVAAVVIGVSSLTMDRRDSRSTPLPVAAIAEQSAAPVVVLPFTVDSAGTAQAQSFARSLTHNLVGNLAHYRNLRVVSSGTSDRYRAGTADIDRIYREVGAPFAIAGQVEVNDDDVSVKFQLVSTADRLNLWTDQVRREHGDLGPLAENITRGISRALAIEINAADARRRGETPGSATEAANLTTLGFAAEQIGPWRDNMSEAMRLFNEALLRNPNFTRAMLGVARVSVMAKLNLIEVDPPVDLRRAGAMLDKILERDPNNPHAQYIFGQLQKVEGRYAASIRSFERAVELNPSFIFADAHIGDILTQMGRPQEGLERIERYIRTAPPDEPALGYGYLYLGATQLALDHKRAALDSTLRANAIFPGAPLFEAWLAGVYEINDDHANAEKYAESFRRLSPQIARAIVDGPSSQARQDMGMPPAILAGLRRALSARQD